MKKRLIKVIALAIIALAIIFGYYFINLHFGFSIPCLFKEYLGFYCPGCGLTRMLFSLIKLDFKKAFMYNQFMFLLLPFIVGVCIYFMYLYVVGKKDYILIKIPIYSWIILAIMIILWGLIRNLSMFPYLRP